MQLVELEYSLPNGFHDALLEGIEVDYIAQKALMRMQLHVGDPDGATEDEREAYKRAELDLSGVLYFVIDAPDPKYSYSKKGELWLDAGDARVGRGSVRAAPAPPIPVEHLPDGASAYWFFVGNWNSFIHVAAMSANLRWVQASS